MARKKIGLQIDGIEEYMSKLDQLGGTATMKRAVEGALKSSKQYVNPKINAAVSKPNLPAGGRYSTGDTQRSINKEMSVEWEGMTAGIKVGFDFKKSGPKSIFLMYGTPRMAPASGLKASIYGSATKKNIAKIQEEAINAVIKRTLG